MSGGETLPQSEWIREFYLDLLKEGWKLEEIEEMDMAWYCDLANYHAEKEDRLKALALDNAGL